MEIHQRDQLSQIGAKDVGEELQVMVGDTIVAEDEVGPRVEERILVVAEDKAAIVDLIPWLAIGVGCVAIGPVIVPPLVVRQ